jgi:hypothetical protein
MAKKLLATRGSTGRRAWLERVGGGAVLMLLHELDALSGHWAEMNERLAVARQTRGLRELVRAQVDLLPETRIRLALDQRERRALLNSWLADLRAAA